MKKLLSLVLSLVLIFSALPIFTITASAEYLSGNYYYSISNNEVTLLKYLDGSGSVTVPSTLSGYPVKYINGSAFANRDEVTSITLGDNIVSIGDRAFEYCTSLKSVYIGKNVATIGKKLFYECTALTSLTVSADNLAYSAADGVLFNKDKTTLIECSPSKTKTAYTIPSSVKIIDDYAFYNCKDIKNITIPNGVTTIGKEAFSYCEVLESITIPDSVTSLGTNAFYLCRVLANVKIGTGLTTLPAGAFSNCYSIESLTIPNNITSIDEAAFCHNIKLKSITLPNSITAINNYTFQYCSSMQSITIPDSVTSIGVRAFENCMSLENITIPKNVTTVDGSAFFYCTALTDIYVNASNTSYISNDGVLFSKDKTTLAIFPFGRKVTKYTVPSGTTTIGNSSFSYHPTIESVVLPDGVTTIEENAFCRCPVLDNITLSKTLTTVGGYAFFDCYNLDIYFRGTKKECNITGSLPSGATWYYNSCVGVAAHTYDNNSDATCSKCGYVRDISKICGENAFWSFDEATGVLNITGFGDMYDYNNSSPAWYSKYRNNITSIVIDKGINNIGNYAFKGLTLLTKVTLSKSVDTIGTQSFYGCTNLKSLTINNDSTHSEDGLKVIGPSAFQNCGFTSFTVPETVTEIGNRAFKQCSNLRNVTIKMPYFDDHHTTIGYEAFMDCTALTQLNYKENVTDFPSLCFKNCTSLENFVLQEFVTSVAANAFANCSAMTSIEIHNKSCSIAANSIPSATTIYGYGASTAEAYAQSNGNAFIDMELLTGTCGDNVQWQLDRVEGTLTLTGTGATYNYVNVGDINPFIEHRTDIKSIVIGDGITHLGNRLFKGLNHTTSVTFGKGVKTMGYEVFYADNKLTSVKLNEGLTMIGALTFYNCTGLTQISIPSTVTNIANRGFKGSGLTSVVVPDTVKTLGYEVFMNCANLATVDYTEGTSMLNPRMFENCTSLKTFYFTDNMCRIRSRAFYGCTALQSITFENADNMWGSSSGDAKIASDAFTGCNSTLKMIAKNDSHVETYANRFGFTFVEK